MGFSFCMNMIRGFKKKSDISDEFQYLFKNNLKTIAKMSDEHKKNGMMKFNRLRHLKRNLFFIKKNPPKNIKKFIVNITEPCF
jgi:hypothetical protein